MKKKVNFCPICLANPPSLSSAPLPPPPPPLPFLSPSDMCDVAALCHVRTNVAVRNCVSLEVVLNVPCLAVDGHGQKNIPTTLTSFSLWKKRRKKPFPRIAARAECNFKALLLLFVPKKRKYTVYSRMQQEN